MNRDSKAAKRVRTSIWILVLASLTVLFLWVAYTAQLTSTVDRFDAEDYLAVATLCFGLAYTCAFGCFICFRNAYRTPPKSWKSWWWKIAITHSTIGVGWLAAAPFHYRAHMVYLLESYPSWENYEEDFFERHPREALQVLRSIYEDPGSTSQTRAMAIDVVSFLDTPAAKNLALQAARDPSAEVRCFVPVALSVHADDNARRALLTMRNDSNRRVREGAIRVLDMQAWEHANEQDTMEPSETAHQQTGDTNR